MKREDIVYGVIMDAQKKNVLMVKNVGGGWTLPGGAVEKGETLEEALIREVKEETNLTIEVESLLAVNEAFFIGKDVHPLFFTFNTKMVEGKITIPDPEEIEDIQWMELDMAEAQMPYFREGIEELLKGSLRYTFQGKKLS
ncbi:NUDIX hydrolase [Bacillus sp. SCS-153A]|uniref:NUDIX hydrolase n=1 Tax=Rossellomorea sedimentorum TaxID=3115294 RepID=UPI003906CD2E